MNAFLKYLLIFIFAIIAIVLANMIYDYIRVMFWGNAINDAINDYNNNVAIEY